MAAKQIPARGSAMAANMDRKPTATKPKLGKRSGVTAVGKDSRPQRERRPQHSSAVAAGKGRRRTGPNGQATKQSPYGFGRWQRAREGPAASTQLNGQATKQSPVMGFGGGGHDGQSASTIRRHHRTTLRQGKPEGQQKRDRTEGNGPNDQG
jgi:hypothetical protein